MRFKLSFERTLALATYSFFLLLVASPRLATGASGTPSSTGYPRLMQGPMVGAVSPTGARIWVRTNGEYEVAVEIGTSFDFKEASQTEHAIAHASADYTAVLAVDGLEADREYFYRIKVDGKDDRYLRDHPAFRFRTAPRVDERRSFRVAFGSCPRFQDDRVQPIWSVVQAFQPELFLWIGDNVYSDSTNPQFLREEYRRQRDVATLQPVLRNISNLAVWDDHDFGLNNHDRTNPIKAEALVAFKDYWANPGYGLPDLPGVFFRYPYGAVDFFFLDDRFYRDPNPDPDTPEKTLLGAEQLEWLKSGLVESSAVFKVLVSGGGWSVNKGHGGDSWASFLNERNGLFDFIRDREISGVVLVSGDTHVGEINVIPWSDHGGYDFYDLVSSPLAQTPPDSWLHRRPEKRVRPVYFQGSNVGVIDFILDATPRVRYRVIDTAGRNVWEPVDLFASELVNGKRSWPDKVSDEARKRQEWFDAGKGYYEKDPEE